MANQKRRVLAIVAGLVLLGGQGALLVQAQRGLDLTRMKSSDTLRTIFIKATAKANQSTVMIRSDEKGTMRQVSLGTVISADGYVLTKGSEVIGPSKVWVAVKKGNGAKDYEAKIVGWSAALDLAMLKIDATGLTPVEFADTRPPAEAPTTQPGRRGGAGPGRGLGGGARAGGGPGTPGARGVPGAGGTGGAGPATQSANGGPSTAPSTQSAGGGARGRGGRGGRGGGRFGGGPPEITVAPELPTVAALPNPPTGALRIQVGEWVASASPAGSMEGYEEPVAVGVVSVNRRKIAGRNGFLGVQLEDAPNNAGAKITQVIPESAADKAGVKLDDVITGVDGKGTANRVDLVTEVQTHSPGEDVVLSVRRGEQNLTLRATLGVNDNLDSPEASEMQKLMGPVNKRASDFPAVLQHDTVIRPVDCGGPLVDLEGHVVGINIARAGRTETYAIPADVIVPLLEPLKSGKLAPVNGNSPVVKPGEKVSTMPEKGE